MKNKKLILKTKNINKQIERDIRPFINLLTQKQYVEGIVLLGGLGKREFLDQFSDIDIAIFYETGIKRKYFLPFEFHVIIDGKRYEFNIHQLFYDAQINIDWDEGTKEAYSRAIVLVDKKKRIKKLIKSKIIFNEKMAYNRLMWLIQQYVWRGQVHAIRSYYRGYPEVSHDLLNECQELLIEAIYILNKRYRGHKKWRIAMLTTMDIIPDKFFQNLREAMKIENFTLIDIERRVEYLNKIYEKILKMVQKSYPNFPKDLYRFYYKNFYQLTKNTFQQNFSEKHRDGLTDQEFEQLEGLLCYNQVTTLREAKKYLELITRSADIKK